MGTGNAAHQINVLGFAGSLRQGSYNRALLRSAGELAPPGMSIDVFDLKDIPLYNGDVEAKGDPGPVAAFKQAIRQADALLIATPEYNYGLPGVLKNAIDWASRPPGKSALNHKPVALMGATPGMVGTARAQLQLRQALVFTDSWPVQQPEVLVARCVDKFDGDGKLIDQTTRDMVRKLLDALSGWTQRLRAREPQARTAPG